MKRNLISAWPMWKSDFCMGRKLKLPQFDNFFWCAPYFFIFKKKTHQIEAWNRNIAWLTPTGIQFPNGSWFSGMKLGPFRNPIFLSRSQISSWLIHKSEFLHNSWGNCLYLLWFDMFIEFFCKLSFKNACTSKKLANWQVENFSVLDKSYIH